MRYDIPPVIRRDWTEADRNATIVSNLADETLRHRGLGRTGHRVEVTDHECPVCEQTRTVRKHSLNPEGTDQVAYWCTNPACRYFVADELSYATSTRAVDRPSHPQIWQQTFRCDDCGTEKSDTITVDEYRTATRDDGIVIVSDCNACGGEA